MDGPSPGASWVTLVNIRRVWTIKTSSSSHTGLEHSGFCPGLGSPWPHFTGLLSLPAKSHLNMWHMEPDSDSALQAASPLFTSPTLCSSHRSCEHLMLLLQGMMLCSPNPLESSLPSTHAHLLFQAHWQILLLCIVAPLSAEDECLASASQPQSPGSSFVPWALAFTQLWSPLHSHCGSQRRPYLKDVRWTEECPCVLNLGGPFPLNVNKPFTSVKTLWNVYGFSFLENGLA